MKDALQRRSASTPANAWAPAPARREAGKRATGGSHVPYRFADLSILSPSIPPLEEEEEAQGADVGLPENDEGLGVEASAESGESLQEGCGEPTLMRAVLGGKFKGGKTMDDYYPDWKGLGRYGHPDSGGPWRTSEYVGSNAQFVGLIPSSCRPADFRLEQTVKATRNRVDGVKHELEGVEYSDIARSGRSVSGPPFRQEFQDELGHHISMADPPSQRLGPRNVELDRTFVTSLVGPAGRKSSTWSTSIRIANGTVTQNTITGAGP